ncbi:hypothetical protein ACFQ0G_38855 [Streptomyces chiangmaiensis]
MSFLYPRLLTEQARPLFEEYRHLTVAELAGQVAVSHESAVYVATGGDRISAQQLRELRAGVVDLAERAGFPDDSDRASNAEFDLQVAALLHAEMGMVPAEAASRDVWAFLAIVLLPDVAFWRYPQPPRTASSAPISPATSSADFGGAPSSYGPPPARSPTVP